jgi:hypothetical protein
MNTNLQDVQALIKQSVSSMKLALEAAARLKDGDLKDTPDVAWDLAMFEFLLHEDLDEYAAFNRILDSFCQDHGI